MKRVYCGLAAALLMPLAAMGQDAAQPAATAPAQMEANPVSNHVRQILDRESKLITAAVEEMPAEKYSYHPTPEQMTFAHMVLHMANTNNFLCSAISGMAVPKSDAISDTDSKEKLVAALKSSFDFCTTALANVDDSKLGEQLKLGQRTMSRAGVMITLTDDFYDHYSTAAVYLRLNGLLPPSAQPKK